MVFPLEVLPWVSLGSALFQFFVNLGVWLMAYLLLFGMPHWHVLLLPLLLLPLLMFVMGVSWALASLGVYLRDVGQLIGVFITMLMFLTPIFYPASALPPAYQLLIMLNPLSAPIEMARDLMYWGELPNPLHVLMYGVAALAVAMLGFAWFQKTRKGFADVL